MKSLVELRLSLCQLDGDAQLVLFRLDDRVGALALGRGHVLAQLLDVVIVLNALHQQPGVNADHRRESQAQHENETRIRATKVFPATAPTIALAGAIRAAP